MPSQFAAIAASNMYIWLIGDRKPEKASEEADTAFATRLADLDDLIALALAGTPLPSTESGTEFLRALERLQSLKHADRFDALKLLRERLATTHAHLTALA